MKTLLLRTKALVPAIPLLVLLGGPHILTASGCAPKSANLDPVSQKVYTANEIVERLINLQNAAIQAHAQKQIDTNTARIIVLFTVDAARVLKETPGGWQPQVSAAWSAVKRDVPAASVPQLQVYWVAIDAVIAAFAPVK